MLFRQNNTYRYAMQDHLGNVRAVFLKTSSGGTDMVVFRDYYPFGMEIGGRNYTDAQGYRYGYQGKYAEKDPETGWNAFELRMYDSRIGRWLSIDPAGQYYSPYIGMGNDPGNVVDPSGGITEDPCPACPAVVTKASYLENVTVYGFRHNTWYTKYSNYDAMFMQQVMRLDDKLNDFNEAINQTKQKWADKGWDNTNLTYFANSAKAEKDYRQLSTAVAVGLVSTPVAVVLTPSLAASAPGWVSGSASSRLTSMGVNAATQYISNMSEYGFGKDNLMNINITSVISSGAMPGLRGALPL